MPHYKCEVGKADTSHIIVTSSSEMDAMEVILYYCLTNAVEAPHLFTRLTTLLGECAIQHPHEELEQYPQDMAHQLIMHLAG